jgi:hypothetical protein
MVDDHGAHSQRELQARSPSEALDVRDDDVYFLGVRLRVGRLLDVEPMIAPAQLTAIALAKPFALSNAFNARSTARCCQRNTPSH